MDNERKQQGDTDNGSLQPNKQLSGSNANDTNTQVCANLHISVKQRSNSLNENILTGNFELPQTSSSQGAWNKVPYGKRGRESPHSSPKPQKQTKLDMYWLENPIRNQNKFSDLEVDAPDVPKQVVHKPPPIFVDKVSNIQPLLILLNKNVPESFEIKVLNLDRIKIQPKLPEVYSKIVKILEEKNTEFYTYKPKEERNFKVFLRNMHYSVNTEEIEEELKILGHNVVNIWNIKHRQNKNPLSLFAVELQPKENNKEIYKVKGLLHTRVVFEPPRSKREMPQCSNCQHYGHTKACCHRKPTCIKCAGEHKSAVCPRKTRSNDVKCALCGGNHPANYKGCQIYKNLHRPKFPVLKQSVQQFAHSDNVLQESRRVTFRHASDTRPTVTESIAVQKSLDTSSSVSARQPRQSSDTSPSVSVWQPGQSYASIARGRGPSSQPHNTYSATRNASMPESYTPNDTSFAGELKEMMSFMRQMMQQMSEMTSLLVNLTTRLSANSIP